MTDEVLPYSRSTQQRERDALRAAQSRGTVIPPDDDTLRTRIAAVQRTHRLVPINEGYKCTCGWEADPPPGWSSDYGGTESVIGHPHHVADAVIRELGLRLDRIPDIAGPDWGTHDRWVTPTVFVPGHLHRGGRR